MQNKRQRVLRFTPFFLALPLFIAFTLAGCSNLIHPVQTDITSSVLLNAGMTVGQTFVASNDGLSGLQLFLTPQSVGNGVVQLHVRTAPDSTQDLAVSRLPVQAIASPGYYTFSFPTQRLSRRQYYYAFLKVRGSGELQVAISPGNTYLNGSAYIGHTPADAQLAFQIVYHPIYALLGLAREMLQWAGILAVAGFGILLPGWAMLSYLMPAWEDYSWMEKIGLASGLGLALLPLFLLWTDLIGLHLGALYAWLPPAGGSVALLWKNRSLFSRLFNAKKQLTTSSPHIIGRRLSGINFVLLALLALLIFTRFWPVRSLEGPMWGDSYQHAVITQLLVDHGGLFDSWQPYADLATFTYHFGFHSAAAMISWIAQISAPRSVLWTGQALNLLAILSLYPLACKVGRNRLAGIIAIAIAGLCSPMPMFYTNWGRYTQLAGQVILPAAMIFLWIVLESSKLKWQSICLSAIAFGGLALTHLRVVVMAGAFLAALLLLYLRKNTIKPVLSRSFWVGLGAGILFLPWFVHLFAGKIIQIFTWQIQTSASEATAFFHQYNQIGDLLGYLPGSLWLLMLAALVWGLWRRDKATILVGLWWLLLMLLTNPHWVGLPGSGAISNFALFIAIYIPASILIGAAFGWLAEWLIGQRWREQAIATLVGTLLLAVSLWGAIQRIQDIQPTQFAMLTRPDMRAAAWIRKNTPPEARFFVNAFLAFGGGSSAGSDAGWWLPLLTGRQTTLPPMNYSFEQGPWPNYQQWINELTAEFQTKGTDHPEFLDMLHTRRVNYIYIGQRQGQVGNPGAPVLDAKLLLANPNYIQVYHQDHVYIFMVKSQVSWDISPESRSLPVP